MTRTLLYVTIILSVTMIATWHGNAHSSDNKKALVASHRADCAVDTIRRTAIVDFGSVSISKNSAGKTQLTGMTPPRDAFGVLDIVDVGLSPGFFGVISATGGPFFYIAEVLGWSEEVADVAAKKHIVVFRDGSEVMQSCLTPPPVK
ncbi:hypothetical protein ACQZV8_01795 [Magnetococcales bacterium HHB-1]